MIARNYIQLRCARVWSGVNSDMIERARMRGALHCLPWNKSFPTNDDSALATIATMLHICTHTMNKCVTRVAVRSPFISSRLLSSDSISNVSKNPTKLAYVHNAIPQNQKCNCFMITTHLQAIHAHIISEHRQHHSHHWHLAPTIIDLFKIKNIYKLK